MFCENVHLFIYGFCSRIFRFDLVIAKQAFSLIEDPKDLIGRSDTVDLSFSQGEIVFENVSFCYGERNIFGNKNLKIAPREKVDLVAY